jgi:hypothetical protein
MKIKKTPFSLEIDFTPEEIEQMYYRMPLAARVGLIIWIKNKFGLNLATCEKNLTSNNKKI